MIGCVTGTGTSVACCCGGSNAGTGVGSVVVVESTFLAEMRYYTHFILLI